MGAKLFLYLFFTVNMLSHVRFTYCCLDSYMDMYIDISLPSRLSIGLGFLDLLFLERENQKTKIMLSFLLVEKVYRQST